MFVIKRAALLVLVLALTAAVLAAPPEPPTSPLAYSDWGSDQEFYNVYDFRTEHMQQMQRPEGYRVQLFVSPPPQEVYEFSAPEDASVRFVLREVPNDSAFYTYTLSRLIDGEEHPIAENVVSSQVTSPSRWSPDSRYLYFQTYASAAQPDIIDLVRYDVQTGSTLTLPRSTLRFCDADLGCVLSTEDGDSLQISVLQHGADAPHLLASFPEGTRVNVTPYPEFDLLVLGYTQPEPAMQQGILFLDSFTFEERFAYQPEQGRISGFSLSPEGDRFVNMLTASEQGGTWIVTELITGEQVTSTTSGYGPLTGYAIQYTPQWLPDNRFTFHGVYEGQAAVFVMTLDDGEVYTTFTFDADSEIYPLIHDQAWSPDGDWLAYTYDTQLHIVPWDGSTAPQPLLPDVTVRCVEWLPEVDYTPDALLCDKHWGIG